MQFNEQINTYINELGCSAKDLAEASQISASVISRYRTGERIPSPYSDTVNKLAQGIAQLYKKKYDIADESEIYTRIHKELTDILAAKTNQARSCFSKLNLLITSLSLRQADIARTFNYDASFISRVLSGQRYPSDIEQFLTNIITFISEYDLSDTDMKTLSGIILVPESLLQTRDERFAAINNWVHQKDTPSIGFISKLSDFDLNNFLSPNTLDNVNLTPSTYHIPVSKSYFGIEEMRMGEIDFVHATCISPSMEDVYMYSDMSLSDLLTGDFSQKYMLGLALLAKKGLKIHIIHDLDRPLSELLLGLEMWMPIYMTGLVQPYYFKGYSDNIFSHLIYTSGSIIMHGHSLAGLRNHGKYRLSRKADDISFYKQYSKDMVERATPLMRIFRNENKADYDELIEDIRQRTTEYKGSMYVPPVCTMSKKLLNELLEKYKADNPSVSEEELNSIRQYHHSEYEQFKETQKRTRIHTRIQTLPIEAFDNGPVYLSLSSMFSELCIPYTYDIYLKHLKELKAYCKNNPNFTIEDNVIPKYKNIQIRCGICKDGNKEKHWSLISKETYPSIHFYIEQPELCKVIFKSEFSDT